MFNYGNGKPISIGCEGELWLPERRRNGECSVEKLLGMASMQLYMCGECGATVTGFTDEYQRHPPNYCPNCGAKAVGR